MSRLPASIAPGINDEPTGRPVPSSAGTAPPRPASASAASPAPAPTGLPGMPPPSAAWHPAATAPAIRAAGSLGPDVTIHREDAVIHDLQRDDLRLPIGVLLLGLAASVAIQAGGVWAELGGLGSAMVAVGVVVSVCFGILVNTPSAVLVGRMFGEDYGPLPSLVLRVAAVCAAQGLVGAFLGGFLALLLGLPVFIGFAVWLIGMDFFQAFVLAVVATAANILLGALLAGSIGAMMFAGL